MKKIMMAAMCGLLSLSIVGCDTMTRQDVGVVTGGTIGALVGSRFGGGSGRSVAIAAGAVTGAIIGGQIGRSMDIQDQRRVYRVLETSPTNRSKSWVNPDTGHQYTVTPVKTYQADGRYCREYTTKAIINNQAQTVYGKACRQPDGSWQVVR